ncbi:flagellar biosynthesis protein FlgN, partial [Salmonella enterica subsp. enterica serovar Infantis]
LNVLKTVMDVELLQVCVFQIYGSQIHLISEEICSLLATMDYLEQQLRLEQNAHRCAIDDIAERCVAITVITQHLVEL